MRPDRTALASLQGEAVCSTGPLGGLGAESEGRCLPRGREGSEARGHRASTSSRAAARLI